MRLPEQKRGLENKITKWTSYLLIYINFSKNIILIYLLPL